MIELKEAHYISQGGFQKCYFHPENEALCIKVKKNEDHEDARVDRELNYYKKIQKKKNPLRFLAKYHGEINTNLGLGYVFDLIRDETSKLVSLTLYDYLKMETSPFSDTDFLQELNKIKKELIENKIVARDIKAKNLCCRIAKDNSLELVLIDGIGHRDFIPVVDWLTFFSRKKTNRIFHKKKLNSIRDQRQFLESLNP